MAMRFKIGDKVRVINKSLESYNSIGTIVDIDEDWSHPYELDFDGFEGQKFEEELFMETDLSLVEEAKVIEPKKPRDFINIKFQEGTVLENGVNGAQIEDVIEVLIERLQGFQKGKFSCRENALAITKLQEARMWLEERTRNRKKQGVEGENINHE